ncbi:MAG: CopG family transcriptional regulator [Erysipelotrichaceae bacterium]|nr:CopG family transcriptional regulator [Erysipelotrichaceae bacterium]
MKVDKKTRIQISLTPELDDRVNKLADKMGVSKPQLCSMLVAQQFDIFEKTWEIMQSPDFFSKVFKLGEATGGQLVDTVMSTVKPKK